MTNELVKPIGTKEQPKLSAGSVIVKSIKVTEKESEKKGKKLKFKIVEISCLHPDKPEEIILSNMKVKIVQGNNETISKDGIWYREDEDGNIDKNCNTAKLLKFYNKPNLQSLENSSIITEQDANGYLCVKAY